jgi:hypothetical protein
MIFTFSLLVKNPVAPAVKREADEDWGGSAGADSPLPESGKSF